MEQVSVRSLTEIAFLSSRAVRPIGSARVTGGTGGRVLLYDADAAGEALALWRRLRDEAAELVEVRR